MRVSRCRFGKINICLGGSMFWWVRQSNYDREKGSFVWPSVGMFGGSMSLECFGRFLNQITTGKKVQLSGLWLQCLGGSVNLDCLGRLVAIVFLAGSLIKLQFTTGKKGTVVWPSVGNQYGK